MFTLNPLGFQENSDNKVDKIYLELAGMIAGGELKAGTIISENEIAAKYGISRTPVREALRRLQQDRWVTVIRGVGMQVTPISMTELREILEVKELLECSAIQKAALSATPKDLCAIEKCYEEMTLCEENERLMYLDFEIHHCIWKLTDNTILFDYLRDMHARYFRAWKYFLDEGRQINRSELCATLGEIIRCIKEKDLNAVPEAEHRHEEFHRRELSAF